MSQTLSVKRILFFIATVLAVFILIAAILFFFNRKQDIPLSELKAKYCNFESEFVEIDGMQVHYRDEGSGDPIILLHGTAASLHTWDDWTEDLKKTHRVIRMDLPAFGLTGANSTGDYSSANYLQFVDAFVLRLKLNKFRLGGNSLGGKIAWHYALEHPHKVEELILVDPSGMDSGKGVPAVFKLARTPILSGLIKYITPRSMIEKNLKEVYHDDSKISEELVDRYYEMTLRKGNRQAFIDRARLIEEDRSAELSKITQPTLLIWGEEDFWTPFENASRFAKAIPNAQLKVMKNTGHVPMEERPVESLKFVQQFLNRKTKGSQSKPFAPSTVPVEQQFSPEELEALELETMEEVP